MYPVCTRAPPNKALQLSADPLGAAVVRTALYAFAIPTFAAPVLAGTNDLAVHAELDSHGLMVPTELPGDYSRPTPDRAATP